MININRGTGFMPDLPGVYEPHHELMRASRIIIPKADHYIYRSGYCYQNGYGICVYETIKRAIQLRFAILGIDSEFLISAVAASIFGRAWEYAHDNPGIEVRDIPKLEDNGSRPQSAMMALRNGGVIKEHLMTGPEAYDSFDSSNIFMAPKDFPNHLLVEAYELSGINFVEVDYDTFEDFCAHINTLMKQGFPIMWALNANSPEYQACNDSVVNHLAKIGHNHYNALLYAEGNEWRSDNWWRRGVIRTEEDEWGQSDGTWLHTPHAMYEGGHNVLAVTWNP